jgi:ClpP class serine protease
MASWSELVAAFKVEASKTPNTNWLGNKLKEHLDAISKRRGDATVIFYASAFLQKATDDVSITREDINGFMNALSGTPTDNGLVLILHTPGGDPNAVESIVEYLHAKFNRIDVLVPYLAMSGGAMISLASDLLILGKQSQLGPIDPQFLIGNKVHSARPIQEGFNKAREDQEKCGLNNNR